MDLRKIKKYTTTKQKPKKIERHAITLKELKGWLDKNKNNDKLIFIHKDITTLNENGEKITIQKTFFNE